MDGARGNRRGTVKRQDILRQTLVGSEEANANLTVRVFAPAFDESPDDGARVPSADRHRGCAGHRNRTPDIHRHEAARDRQSVPQLPAEIGSPALHAAGDHDRAGIELTGADLHDGTAESDDVDRRVARRRGAVAQLTIEVPAPALEAATVGDGAGVLSARRNRDRRAGAEPDDVDRYGAACQYVVTQPSKRA